MRGVKLCGESKNAIRVLERNRSGERESNTALRAIKEARVQLLLQVPYLRSHGGLRHEKCLCRLRERQVLRRGIENLESPIRHEGNRSSSGRTALRHRAHHTGLTVRTCYPSRRATCARNVSDGL
jgi:hypothetical protein